MNISRTSRKVAAALRVQVKDDVVMVVQEGSTDEDQLWIEFYTKDVNYMTRSLSFNLSHDELRELCGVLQEFMDEVVLKPALEMAR